MKEFNELNIETKIMTKEQAYESERILNKLEIDGWFGRKSFAHETDKDEITIIMYNEDVDDIEGILNDMYGELGVNVDFDYLCGTDEIEVVGSFGNEIFTEMAEKYRLCEMIVTGISFMI